MLEVLELYSLGAFFIKIILNLMLMLFVLVAALLIYSFTEIQVRQKTYEHGLMRLVGFSKSLTITLTLTYTLCYVIPALLCAYGVSYPCLRLIFSKFFEPGELTDLEQDHLSNRPSENALVFAMSIGILVPAVGIAVPIARAVIKPLYDSLNT